MRAAALAALLGGALAIHAAVPGLPELLARAQRAELAGKAEDAARDATRVVVEAPGSDAAAQAAAVLGRVRLAEGAFGEAAWWLQRAGSAADLGALRALAVRSLLRQQGVGGVWGALQDVAATEVRRPAALVRLPSGARAVLDGRAATLTWILADGRVLPPVALGEVQSAAAAPDGRLLVAAGDRVVVFDGMNPEGEARPFAGLGRFAPAAALAVDAAGAVWVADRKGARLGRLAEGGSEPSLVAEPKGLRAEALAPLPPGRGIAVLDARAGALYSLDGAGTLTPLPALPWGERGRPVGLASDASGQLAVLDGRTGEVVLLDAAGAVLDRLAVPASDREAPQALALGRDGSLEVVGADGRLRRSP